MSIQIRWLAHALFQIKAEETTIYLDPRFMRPLKSKVGKFFEAPEVAKVVNKQLFSSSRRRAHQGTKKNILENIFKYLTIF